MKSLTSGTSVHVLAQAVRSSQPVPLLQLASLTPAERLAALGSTPCGLSEMAAAEVLAEVGPNTPVPPQPRRPLLAFAANFTHTLALLLWFAGGLAFAAGAPQLGGAIIAVVAVNGLFAFVQEYRAEQVVAGLLREVAVQASVIRNGVERRIPSQDLVPGDVVRLCAGDIVPADCVLLEGDELAIDLSMLTGESLPVARDASPVTAPDHAHISDLPNVAPAGSAVVTGSAQAIVCATGPRSTLGQVSALVEGVQRGDSVLERQIATLSQVTATVAVLSGVATLLLASVLTATDFISALTFATGVIVALVPEGLLPTLSVSLALGARRMAARGAAVRRLSSVEIIGSVTVVCTDKTGTLTLNSLSVLGFESAGMVPEAQTTALLAGALCNDARIVDGGFDGDPLDVAVSRWAATNGCDPVACRERYPRVASLPFDAHRRYMSVTCSVDGSRQTFIKGAPEAVLELTGAAPPAFELAIEAATVRGERVLLLASGDGAACPVPLGLLRFYDPPRPGVPEAVADCRRAGVRIIMLTGDHPVTARTVATAVGLDRDVPVIEGEAVAVISDDDLLGLLGRDAIFARIDPEQKLRIVTLLRRAGEVVVVTGDGVNDAPALRAADVGVAMGVRGTEVAKQAADVVLADDNFATIVAAIQEGRSIKVNIRRFVSYVFTHDVAELAPFIVYIFFAVPLPLAIIQVLAIDLGTDLLPALALGAEPPSGETMSVPPEPPQRPLLTLALGLKAFLFFGLIEAALGLVGFFAYYLANGWRPFETLSGQSPTFEHQAATLTFLGIVSGQLGCLIANRDGSLRKRLSLRSNRWIALGLGCELALALLLVYVPGLNGVFSMRSVSPAWLVILPLGGAAFLTLDLGRRVVSRIVSRRRRSLETPERTLTEHALLP